MVVNGLNEGLREDEVKNKLMSHNRAAMRYPSAWSHSSASARVMAASSAELPSFAESLQCAIC